MSSEITAHIRRIGERNVLTGGDRDSGYPSTLVADQGSGNRRQIIGVYVVTVAQTFRVGGAAPVVMAEIEISHIFNL